MKDYQPNWTEEISVTKKVKDAIPCTYVIEYLRSDFSQSLELKMFEKKSDELYVKWIR